MRKKIIWAIFGVITLAGLAYYYATSATQVDVVTVGKGDISRSVVDTGYVKAVNQSDVLSTQGGRVINLPVSVGQSVEKDQVLMVLENKDLAMSSEQLQIQMTQARTAVNTARTVLEQGAFLLTNGQTQFNRTEELYRAGAISQADYETARSQLDQTIASVEAQNQALQLSQEQVNTYQSLLNSAHQKEQELQIRSPIRGTVMTLPVQQGSTVINGTLLAQVALTNDLEIQVNLLSDDLKEIQVGQTAQITAPVLGDQTLSGKIAQIYPQAEEEQSALGIIQRRVPTIITLDSSSNLKPGYETRVSIITASKKEVVLIPQEAVLTAANGQLQVMLIMNGRVKFQEITTGLTDSKNIEIIGGLQPGDQIVKDARVNLKANDRVKAKQA